MSDHPPSNSQSNAQSSQRDWWGVHQRDDSGFYPPPWRAYRDLPRFSIGWRMAGGEVYLHGWTDWYADLAESERRAYRWRFWPPPTWWDFYLHHSKYVAVQVISTAFTLIWIFTVGFPFLLLAYVYVRNFKRQI